MRHTFFVRLKYTYSHSTKHAGVIRGPVEFDVVAGSTPNAITLHDIARLIPVLWLDVTVARPRFRTHTIVSTRTTAPVVSNYDCIQVGADGIPARKGLFDPQL